MFQTFGRLFSIFKIKHDERWVAFGVVLSLVCLNALLIIRYYGELTPLTSDYWHLFIRRFHVSGFDPITYHTLSDWEVRYNPYRHPLLAFFMYVPYLVNKGLMALTGINCAIFIVALMMSFFALYAQLFLYRILREVVGNTQREATILTFLFFSFAYIMLSSFMPDHFIISMFLLLLVLYISGRKIKQGKALTIWQTIACFFFTAGTSLNNGLKVFLSGLFVNGKRFFRIRYMLFAVLIPAALIWGFSRFEYRVFVLPGELQRHEMKAKLKKIKAQRELVAKKAQQEAAQKDSLQGKTSQHKTAQAKKADAKPHHQWTGTPIMGGEFMRWTDISTSRVDAAVESLFGESIQLHEDYLLGDVMKQRPIIVKYNHWYNYAVEAVVVALFVIGVWCGRRSRFLWLVMSYFMMDMLLHMGLGFGINEVYIMTAHWAYALPIAIGFLFRGIGSNAKRYLSFAVSLLALYLFIYNFRLIAIYLL